MEGGHNPKFFDSNGPLRGFKRDLTEGGIRVPFLARWPGQIKPGTSSDHPSVFYDFLPTAVELAGGKAPDGIDGISYVNAMLGKPQQAHEFLYWEFAPRGGKQAVRMGKWKGLREGLQKNDDAPLQVYDLSQDIGEEKNVAAQNPEIAKKLLAIMQREHVRSEMFPLMKSEYGNKKKK